MRVILNIPDEVLEDVKILANNKRWSRKQYMENTIIIDSISKRSERIIKQYKEYNEPYKKYVHHKK